MSRYEIRDTHYPKARGMRFRSLEQAQREHSHAVPRDRFRIIDRETGTDVTTPGLSAPTPPTTKGPDSTA
ncbi:MAG: hypothetical protein GY773_00940 [Actinomycetia bacterium]|nr:hypothetical protein [Actinomycetes bacterium]